MSPLSTHLLLLSYFDGRTERGTARRVTRRLTSHGMVARSRPPGRKLSRAVALWSDPSTGVHEISLGRGSLGVLLTANVGCETAWTADGRRHAHYTPRLTLAQVRQLR